MANYTVRVENTFDADTPEEAVLQMAAWLVDYAYAAGYRVFNEDEPDTDSMFIDAENISQNEFDSGE